VHAIVVTPPHPGARLADVPDPVGGPEEVRVRVLETGVCGTDRDIVRGIYGTPPEGKAELVLGHENLGRIVQVGSSVRGLEVGDLVVATVRRGCGLCRFCRSNKSDFCETGLYTERGIKGRDGYFAEFYVDRPEYLVRVPRPHRLSAVLLEPLSVVEKAIVEGTRVLDRMEPTPGQPPMRARKALVTGTGAVGLLGSLVLATEGYEVTAIDRHGEDTSAAKILAQVGIRHVNVAEGLKSLGELKFDLILEASGSAALDLGLVPLLAANGALVLTGIPSDSPAPIPVPAAELFRGVVLNNQVILGSVNANRRFFALGLRHLTAFRKRWGTVAEQLVTARVPLDQFAHVFEAKDPQAIKTVMTIGS
jgi:threonine dehydrogenase-like Zn-dependent dehydrogenase